MVMLPSLPSAPQLLRQASSLRSALLLSPVVLLLLPFLFAVCLQTIFAQQADDRDSAKHLVCVHQLLGLIGCVPF